MSRYVDIMIFFLPIGLRALLDRSRLLQDCISETIPESWCNTALCSGSTQGTDPGVFPSLPSSPGITRLFSRMYGRRTICNGVELVPVKAQELS